MVQNWDHVQLVRFNEMPVLASGEVASSQLQIVLGNEFSVNDYCIAVLDKIISIDLSEISSFLDWQCHLVTKPLVWLNQLEKLVSLNVRYFNTPKLKHRYTKLITQIDIKRLFIKSQQNEFRQLPTAEKKVACVAGETVFSFDEVKAHLETLTNIIDKRKYLKQKLHEYRQSDPDIIYTKVRPLDKQVEAELQYLEELEELEMLSNKNHFREPQAFYGKNKIKITCQLNQFVDVFFQLTKEIKYNGKPVLEAEPTDIAEFLTHCFVDKDNNNLSIESIKTILNPSRVEKRPKPNKRIDLKDRFN